MPSSSSTQRDRTTLFDSDDEAGDDTLQLKIDRKYAAAYQSRKEKEELRTLALEDSDASSSSEEDEDAELLTEELDVNIFKTINALRRKDDKIYDPNVRFFDQGSDDGDADDDDGSESDNDDSKEERVKKTKPKRYKDVVREQVLEQMERDDASEADGSGGDSAQGSNKQNRLAYDAEQEEIRKAFLKATKSAKGKETHNSDDDDDDDDNLLTVKHKHKPSDPGLSKELEEELEKLRSTQGATKDLVDPRGEVKDGEAFLVDFFKKKTWKQPDSESEDESDDESDDQKIPMKGGSNENDDENSLDELEKADDFEAQYNFRFEQATAATASGADHSLVTYARDMSGTLRRKDETRKEKRLARKERKAAERKAKEEELKRLKNLKKQEINEKLKQVKKVLGEVEGRGETVDEAAILKLIEGDFDPDKYEKLMTEAYGEDFYTKEDAEWKSELDIRNTLKNDEDGDILVGQDDEYGGLYDDEAQGYDEDDGEYADQEYDDGYNDEEEVWAEEEPAEEETQIERQVREKLTDELYKLDYEDIVAGQPTRFKYRKVEANSFGLSTEEILFARDTTLRQFVSLKKMAPYNEQEYHVNSRKRRKFREMLKQDLEASVEETGESKADADNDETRPKKKSRRSKKSSKSSEADDGDEQSIEKKASETNTQAEPETKSKDRSEKGKKDKKKRKKKSKTKEPAVPGLSTSRLAAYGL